MSESVAAERIHVLGSGYPIRGAYVLYWMQSAMRLTDNHALSHAAQLSAHHDIPLLVVVCLDDTYPDATDRSHTWFLSGVSDVILSLADAGIAFQVVRGSPPDSIASLLSEAAVLVTDDKPLRHHRAWLSACCDVATCPVHVVETAVVVPVSYAMEREAYSAAVLRPRLMKALSRFLDPVPVPRPSRKVRGDMELTEAKHLLGAYAGDVAPGTTHSGGGGERAALSQANSFLHTALHRYDTCRNDPSQDCTSHLSAYLHYGQLSPVTLIRDAIRSGGRGLEAFIEQVVVRRELAFNFVHFNKDYDTVLSLPSWASQTLLAHENDAREYIYTIRELEAAETHDPYWNAAQRQMVFSGYMHGYMRMYWGKKILEWTSSLNEAYHTALSLNNTYEIDGRDPNGYAGVAWVFGKHDRPWKERDIFGTIRYRNDRGLERKFDMGPYLQTHGL